MIRRLLEVAQDVNRCRRRPPACGAAVTVVAFAVLVAAACDGKARPSAVATAEWNGAPAPARRTTVPRARFIPPDADKRRAAIGDVSTLAPALRRAFTPSDQFSAIPIPDDSDWLAEHKEPGQSYADYVASLPNRTTATRQTIYLQPIGTFSHPDSPRMTMLADFVRRYYQLPVKLLPALAEHRVSTYRRIHRGTRKPQLLSGEILRYLEDRVPRDAYCLIAVTETDLYPQPSWNFVFGQASLSKRVGVYSFARYHPSFHGDDATAGAAAAKLVLARALKVMVHELGHMFGIRHCTHFACVMNGSNSMDESDSQPAHLCPVCLRKLHHARRYDPVARYRGLQAFYARLGLDEQRDWIRQRLRAIE